VLKPFRLEIPPHVADVIRSLNPDLKKSIRAAINEIAVNPNCGQPLQGVLCAYWKYRVRRFRIVYSVNRRKKIIRVVAVAARRSVYEDLALQLMRRR
jgi:mRNA interferase RelE/StbE